MTIYPSHHSQYAATNEKTLHMVFNPLDKVEVTIPIDPAGTYTSVPLFTWETDRDSRRYHTESVLTMGPGASKAALQRHVDQLDSSPGPPVDSQLLDTMERNLARQDRRYWADAETISRDSQMEKCTLTHRRTSQCDSSHCGPGSRSDVPDIAVAYTGETVKLIDLDIAPMLVVAEDGATRMSFTATYDSLEDASTEHVTRVEQILDRWANTQGDPIIGARDAIGERDQMVASLGTAMSSLKKFITHSGRSRESASAEDGAGAGFSTDDSKVSRSAVWVAPTMLGAILGAIAYACYTGGATDGDESV